MSTNTELYHVVTPQERDEIVSANFPRFSETARSYAQKQPQPLELRTTYQALSRLGIWQLLNNINGGQIEELSDEDRPLIFTGQQPTLDYGIYRRFAKRSGVHSNVVTVHHHADHDHASKPGFRSVEVPIFGPDHVKPHSYSLPVEFKPEEVMHLVAPPAKEKVENFFLQIINDVKHNPHTPPGTDLSIITDCASFISTNYHLIRSTAELNAVIQSFLVRRISPETKTIELMLSDLLKSPTARKSLAQLMLEMPTWISAYNSAVTHVHQTDYGKAHVLPMRLQEVTKGSAVFKELPIWVIDPISNQRSRAWMLERSTDPNNLEFGAYSPETNSDFRPLMQVDRAQDVNSILNDPNFSLFSPGAVALVDLLREKLHLPIIHGKTGHMYEAINEVARARLLGIEIPPGKLAIPSEHADMSPISAASHNARKRGPEASDIQHRIASVRHDKSHLRDMVLEIQTHQGKKHAQASELAPELLAQLGLKKTTKIKQIPTDHELHGLADEYKSLIASPPLSELEITAKLNFPSQPSNVVEQLYLIGVEFGEDELTHLLSTNPFPSLSRLWAAFLPWRRLKNERREMNAKKTDLSGRIEHLNTTEEQLLVELQSDSPLISTAIYRPRAVTAISRLERRKVSNGPTADHQH